MYAYYNVHSIIDNIEILILRAHGALIRDYTVRNTNKGYKNIDMDKLRIE